MLGYLCAYMRCYYPKEFICAFLNCAKDTDDIYNGTLLAKQKDIKINKIKFRKSGDDYMPDPNSNSIYKGLASIKGMSKTAGSELLALKNKTYKNFIKLLIDIGQFTTINKTQLENLIKLNYFEEFGAIHKLLKIKSIYEKFNDKKVLSKNKLEPHELEIAKKLCEKETEKQLRGFDCIRFIESLVEMVDEHPINNIDRIRYELQILGTTDIVDIEQDECVYGVEAIEQNKYGTIFIKLYQIATGESSQYKVDKKWWTDNELKQGDIIKVVFKEKDKMKRVGDGFIKTGEKEFIIKMYAKVLTNQV